MKTNIVTLFEETLSQHDHGKRKKPSSTKGKTLILCNLISSQMDNYFNFVMDGATNKTAELCFLLGQ